MTRTSLPRAVLLLLFVTVALLPGASPASAAAPLVAEAVHLITIDHHEFLIAKTAAVEPFDWSTDGCTHTPASWAVTFDGPCQQHDFGYRNLGHGLRLRPTQAARAWVDRRLLAELRRVCSERFAGLAATRCRGRARAMYTAVRLFNPPWS